MVQLLILYYLSIKSTHGYEIQKFIQLNHMEEWNSIQSGSIYYAMNKLERDGLIELVKKIGDKEKSRRIYAITEKGRLTLETMALNELKKPLGAISSEKFLVYPIVASLTKEEIFLGIDNHITALKRELYNINEWYEKKKNKVTNIEKATFKLMKSSVQNQIEWHNIMADNLEETIASVKEITKIIETTDFSVTDEYLNY